MVILIETNPSFKFNAMTSDEAIVARAWINLIRKAIKQVDPKDDAALSRELHRRIRCYPNRALRLKLMQWRQFV